MAILYRLPSQDPVWEAPAIHAQQAILFGGNMPLVRNLEPRLASPRGNLTFLATIGKQYQPYQRQNGLPSISPHHSKRSSDPPFASRDMLLNEVFFDELYQYAPGCFLR